MTNLVEHIYYTTITKIKHNKQTKRQSQQSNTINKEVIDPMINLLFMLRSWNREDSAKNLLNLIHKQKQKQQSNKQGDECKKQTNVQLINLLFMLRSRNREDSAVEGRWGAHL